MKKVMICLIGCFLIALNLRAQDTTRPAPDPARPAADSAKQTSDTAKMMTVLKDSGVVKPATPAAGDTTAQPAGSAPGAGGASGTGTSSGTGSSSATPGGSGDSVISLVDSTYPKGASDAAKTSDGAKTGDAGKTNDPAAKTTDAAAKTGDAAANTTAADAKTGDGAAKTGDAAKTDSPAKGQDTAADQPAAPTSRQLDTRWFISPLLKLQFQDFAMLEKNRDGYLSNANTLPFFSRGNGSFAASAYKNLTSRLSVSADLGLSFGHVTNNSVEISQTPSRTFNLLNATVYYHLLPATYRLQPYVEAGINDIINSASYVTVPIGIGAKFNSSKVMALAQVSYGEAIGKNIANTTMYSVGVYIPIRDKKHKQLDIDDNTPRYNKNDKKDKNKDTTARNGTVINNIYVTINMDSVLRAKGLLNDDGSPRSGGNDGDDANGSGSGHSRKRRAGLKNFDVDDFDENSYKMDSLDGQPAIRFVVYFEFNDFGLNSQAFESIDRVIGHLKRTPGEFTVEIKGYTDSVGDDHYNNWLSRERAKMVLKYMNSRGIPVELMKAKAYGKDNPVADNADPSKAWLNRRAEIIVHAKEAVANGQ
ncbi:MAG TPA: OmpA family protein [Puia sp.]|nr:OmpA family protein [Puia sp.]